MEKRLGENVTKYQIFFASRKGDYELHIYFCPYNYYNFYIFNFSTIKPLTHSKKISRIKLVLF